MPNKKLWDLPRADAITGNEVVPLTTAGANTAADLNFISAWFNAKPTAYNFGALSVEPTVSPFDGGPIPLGAQYYNTTTNQLRAYGSSGWFTPNIDAELLAEPGGATLVGTPTGTVQASLDARPTSAALAASGGAALVGFVQTGMGGILRTQQEKNAERISVKDFGAVGDGIADDTAAIEAGSLAINAAGGGVLIFPKGTYNYTRLTIRTGVIFQGEGAQATYLICKDFTTLDAGIAIGSSIRKPDDGARVFRAGFRDMWIGSGTSGVAALETTFQNIIGLNLCACERTTIDNVTFAGFGQGALVFARAEAGAEGLGFTNTTQDGNYNCGSNIFIASCGRYNLDEAAIWFRYKANSNKLYGVFCKPVYVAFGIRQSNDNAAYGGAIESSKSIAHVGTGAVAASGNLFAGIRAEGLSSDGYIFDALAENNTVFAGYHTGVTGVDFNLTAGPNNRVISDTTNYLRSKAFPPATSYSTLHNLAMLKVTGINGSPTEPLYIKSPDYNTVGSYPYVVMWNDISGGAAGNILGRIGFRNGDTSGGAAGVSAAIDAVLEGSAGTTGLAFSTGTGTTLTEVARITSTGVFRPSTDNTLALGAVANRWSAVYAGTFRPGAGTATWTSGAGTPEGVVTASVGSMFTRTDGGAATTLYVKESGAGNTGWVAK